MIFFGFQMKLLSLLLCVCLAGWVVELRAWRFERDAGDSPMFFENKIFSAPKSYGSKEEEEEKEKEEEAGHKSGDFEVEVKAVKQGNFEEVKKAMTTEVGVVCCRQGYSLLWCGIDHSHYDQADEDSSEDSDQRPHQAYTHPLNTSSCACFASKSTLKTSPKLQCQAWCHKDPLNTATVASSQLLFRTMNAKCAKDQKVLGCHMQFGGGTQEKDAMTNNFFFPLKDGKACFCKDLVGAKCISKCSGEVEGYKVVTSLAGETNAKCPKGTFVTGCGVSQTAGQNYNTSIANPSAYVSSPNSCSCFYPVSISSSPSAFFSSFSSSFCYAVCVEKLGPG